MCNKEKLTGLQTVKRGKDRKRDVDFGTDSSDLRDSSLLFLIVNLMNIFNGLPKDSIIGLLCNKEF